MKTSSVGRPTFNLTDLSSIKFRYRYKIKDLNGSIEGGFVIENQEKRDLYSLQQISKQCQKKFE